MSPWCLGFAELLAVLGSAQGVTGCYIPESSDQAEQAGSFSAVFHPAPWQICLFLLGGLKTRPLGS